MFSNETIERLATDTILLVGGHKEFSSLYLSLQLKIRACVCAYLLLSDDNQSEGGISGSSIVKVYKEKTRPFISEICNKFSSVKNAPEEINAKVVQAIQHLDCNDSYGFMLETLNACSLKDKLNLSGLEQDCKSYSDEFKRKNSDYCTMLSKVRILISS